MLHETLPTCADAAGVVLSKPGWQQLSTLDLVAACSSGSSSSGGSSNASTITCSTSPSACGLVLFTDWQARDANTWVEAALSIAAHTAGVTVSMPLRIIQVRQGSDASRDGCGDHRSSGESSYLGGSCTSSSNSSSSSSASDLPAKLQWNTPSCMLVREAENTHHAHVL